MGDELIDLGAIAQEGYEYLYPLVTMEVTRRQATNAGRGELPGHGPMNEFTHIKSFPGADFKMVVRPNFDTLYSAAFLDLGPEPIVVTAADTDGRYYMLPMLDMWTDVFASPGSRTSGNGAGAWAIVAPGWSGELPAGVERIDAPTPIVWIIGRTQTNGPSDYPAVHAVQDGFRAQPLSTWGSEAPAPTVEIDPSIDMKTPPLDTVNAMSGAEFFAYGAELMKRHAPHRSDWSMVRRLRWLGITPGESFDAGQASPEAAAAIAAAPAAAQQALAALVPHLAAVSNGWQMNTNSIGVYGNFYAKRAVVSMLGLGANPPEDAVYPLLLADADGDGINGETEYVLHFDADELPPVNAFWSVTMYDEHGFQVANELDRFAIGDRDPLVYNADGSLDLYLQHANPGPDKVANWLPAGPGPLGVTMRLYGPKANVLTGLWSPPPLRKA